MAPARLLFLGDQTVNTASSIQYLGIKSRSSFLLKNFLGRTLKVLQSQVSNLDVLDRARLPSFRSFNDLAENQAFGAGDVVLSTILLCVAQLGSLIIQAEEDPRILAKGPESSDGAILGLCTGLLPAAAASASRNVHNLLELAPEIVGVALRLSLYAQRRSSQIEPGTGSWAVVVGGTSAEDLQNAIDEFHFEQVPPLHRRLYISAYSGTTATVSGPPSALDRFLVSSELLVGCRKHQVPIFAAFHAEHLGSLDIEYIVGNLHLFELELPEGSHMISTSSCVQYSAKTIRELLTLAVEDILGLPLHTKKAIDSAISSLAGNEVNFTVFGPTNAEASLRQSLKMAGKLIMDNEEVPDGKGPSNGSPDIAIVGMSGKFPGSGNLIEFWDILMQSKDLHKKAPKDRFGFNTHCDASRATKNNSFTPFGCFIDQPGLFDARMFNISPREALQTDPTHRLLMMATYEALEMAGYNPDSKLSEKFGTFIGMATDDWREYNIRQDIDIYYVTGGLRAFAAGRLNYHFKWDGPSYVIDTVCSSSAASIELACAALLKGSIDVAVAGGGNIMTGSNLFTGLSRGGFLSPTGSCKTLDEGADGYCRGDGVGVVILKRLEDAIVSNDNIQGVVRSIATNHSSRAVSITQPHAPTQQVLSQQVLREAGLGPDDINYVEMHGTGTQAGDTTEITSIVSTFGRGGRRDNPLYIGSVKSNIGHSEAAAGVASVIKSLMMFRKSIVPSHVGIKNRMNSKFPSLAESNIHIARTAQPFKSPGHISQRKRILVNSFGAAGGNTCIVLEEPHQRIVTGKDPRSHHIIALSAKTATSLAGNKERLCGYLMANEDVRLQDLAYTTTARRMHHQFRRSYAVETMDDLLAELSKDSSSSIQTFKMGQVIFAFPGQGSMLPGMGRQLLNTSRTFRQHLIDIDRVSIQLGFPSFIHVATDVSSDLSLLGPTEAHLALVAFEIAMARLWQSWGIKPDLVIGHSIGEYSALCIAGVLSLNDTLFLVGKRAEMIQQHCTKQTHGMLLISCSVEEVKHLLSLDLTTSCEIACLNGPNSIVVGGPLEDIHRIQQSSQKRCKLLGIDYAFHTKQLDLILDSFERIARGIHFARPIIPVASTLRGDVMSDSGVFSATYLREQMRQQVDFLGALRSCKVKNFVNERSLWIEIGPGSMCLNMVQSTLDAPAANLLPTTKANDSCWKTLSESMAHAYNSGVTVDWMEWHQEYESSLQLLDLPNYCWDLKNYWIQYEEKYSKTADGAPKGMELPFLSTCLHRIESEEFSNGILTTTFKSDLRNSQLAELIQGHCVGGVALCPSSVFSEMALAAGSYVHSKLPSPEIKLATEITSLEIFSPLTSQPDAAFHSVEVQATNSMGPRFIQISIRSNTGSASQEHARCTMSFGESTQWISKWSRQVYLLEDRISRLMDYSASGVHHLRKEMVYKLFSSIVQYREAYQSIMEIHMDNKLNEAVAKVRFRNTPKDCTFTYDPCWLDCLAQVPGFILNGSVNIPQDVMYMSTGCGSLQVSTEISGDKEYLCYVRMHQLKSSTGFVGDVSLIDGDKTVAVGTGLKFQEIKKSMLPHLLGSNLSKPRGHRDSLAVDNTDRRRSESSIVGKRQFTNPNVASSATYEPQQAPISLPLKSYIDFEAILSIVAEEAGCKMSEITDETSFEELGVDSLLTISITSRVRTQANQTLPASIFVEFPTIGRLRAQFPPNAFSSIKTVKGNPEKRYDSSSNSSVSKELPTPPSISDSFTEPQADELADIFISALATETGLSMSEINNSSSFTDLGVDSLMGIAVIGRVKDCTSFEIPASIFTDHPTVAGLIEALARFSEDHDNYQLTPQIVRQMLTSTSKATAPELRSSISRTAVPAPFQSQNYSSNAVLLQGVPNSALPTLFLITDGAGSAASYLHLPPLSSGIPVYALESPFLQCPEQYTCTIEEISAIFVRVIQQIQPSGPYLIGGWSIGGTYTYEIIRQLAVLGEKTHGVLIIDGACPTAMHGLPEITIEVLEEMGIFVGTPMKDGGHQPMKTKQKKHILGCVKAVTKYDPIPLGLEWYPHHTVLLWSRRGMFEKLTGKLKEELELLGEKEEGKEKTGINRDWLSGERTSFGPKGWDKLLGVGGMECHAIDGDHFSIMNMPAIKSVTGPVVQDAVEKFLSTL